VIIFKIGFILSKYANPNYAPGEGTKKIIKKKPKPVEDQQPVDNPEEDDETQHEIKPIKEKPKLPATSTEDSEKPKQLKQEHNSVPAAPEENEPLKPIKKKVKKPVAPPEPEPEPEGQDLDSHQEDKGEGEKENHDGGHHGIDMQDNSDNEYEDHDDGEQEDEDGDGQEDENREENHHGEEEEDSVDEPLDAAAKDPFQDTPTNIKDGLAKGTKTVDSSSDATKSLNGGAKKSENDASDKLRGLDKSATSAVDSTADKQDVAGKAKSGLGQAQDGVAK
jgi:hypothetical protein